MSSSRCAASPVLLQESCPELQIAGGVTRSFTACQTLTGISYPFQFQWTQQVSSGGGSGTTNGSLIQAGIVATFDGWAGAFWTLKSA